MEPDEATSRNGATEPKQAPPADETVLRGLRLTPAAWVAITLGLGVLFGIVYAFLGPTALPREPGPGPGFERFARQSDVYLLVSSVSIALLVALLAVYVRTYQQTNANFALGLVFVLLALLVQSVVASPMLIGAFGHPFGPLASFFLVADLFKIAAFTVFLYLSLQ